MANAGAAATGALSGAGTGAAIGSVVPGIGTAIGAVGGGIIGGLTGLFSDAGQDKFQAADPYAPGSLAAALANSQQVQGQQQALAQALVAQSRGQGPNPALLQLKQTTDQNAQAAAGLAASQRGMNPALARQMAVEAQTNANQTAGGQAAVLGAQQQLAATGQLGQLYGTMGQQGLEQQQLMDNSNIETQKINAGVGSQNAQTSGQMMGGLMQGAGALGASALSNQGSTPPPSTGPSTYARGGQIPGRAQVSGDSKTNDTVPAMLSPGEIVIPRSHAENAQMAKEFIDELMSKQKKGKSQGGFGKVLEAHRKLGEALKSAGVK